MFQVDQKMKEHEGLVTSKRVLGKLRSFWASEKNRWGTPLWSEAYGRTVGRKGMLQMLWRTWWIIKLWLQEGNEKVEEGWRGGEGSISNLGNLFMLLGTIRNVFPIFGSFSSLPTCYIPSTSNPKLAVQDNKRQHKKFHVCSASFT